MQNLEVTHRPIQTFSKSFTSQFRFALTLSLAFAAENTKIYHSRFALVKKFELDLQASPGPIELKTFSVFPSNNGESHVLDNRNLQHLPTPSLCDAGNPLAAETFQAQSCSHFRVSLTFYGGGKQATAKFSFSF